MTTPIVSLTEIKTYLGKTGTDDDSLIASIASNATALAESHTGRIFAVASNVTQRYSTDGQSALTILDHPYNDSTRTITLYGATITEGTNCWFLPDRRNQDVSVMIQLRYFDRERPDWFKSDPQWFDKNLDNPRYWYRAGSPNDLVITGTVGHPTTPPDVKAAVLELASWMYWRAKGGASSFAETLTGTDVDLALLPQVYQLMVANWRTRTAVVAI